MEEATLDAVRAIAGFADLDKSALHEIAALCDVKAVVRGARLIREGDRADALYFVISGRFEVRTGGKSIATIGSGEPIGELSFFTGEGRTADVIAARDSTVLELSRSQYDTLLKLHPELSSQIIRSVAKRLAAVTGQSAPLPPRSGMLVTVLGANDEALPHAFLDMLEAEASGRSDVIINTLDDVPDISDRSSVIQWLHNRERAGQRQILVVRDPKREPDWAEIAVALGDSLFIVTSPGQKASLNPESLEADPVIAQTGQMQLVLTRSHQSRAITGTPDWLKGRNINLHHHLALDRREDFARLIRFMCDEAQGLVLGGGGAFGTAHLGAVKALQEAGIEIDFYGGTSVGAAMAAALAQGLDPDEILSRSQDIFVAQRALRRLTAPLFSVLDHRVFDASLQEHYGSAPIEDMPFNFFASAVNLSCHELEVIRTGPVWKAVRISGSIPALLPPVLSSTGEVLVDGGLIDNLPLTSMRGLKTGPNIALEIDLGRTWQVNADYETLPGPLGALKGLVLGRQGRARSVQRFPRIASILTRSMTVNSRKRVAEIDMGQDVLMSLPIKRGSSFMDWQAGPEHFSHSYQLFSDALAACSSPSPKADPLARLRSVDRYLAKDGVRGGA